MRSIMEEKSETSKLKLDDMPLFLKARSFTHQSTCHTSVMRFAGMHMQKYATQKRRTNDLVHVDPVPKTKSSVGGKAISCSISIFSISKCRLQ